LGHSSRKIDGGGNESHAKQYDGSIEFYTDNMYGTVRSGASFN